MSQLSETIAAVRRAAGETQTALAEALGISNRTVSKWETAETEPDAASLVALAEHFGITTDELLGRSGGLRPVYENAGSFGEAGTACFGEALNSVMQLTETITRLCKQNWSRDGANDALREPVLPSPLWDERFPGSRKSGATCSAVFAEAVKSRDNNMILMLLPNENNFAWMDEGAEALAKRFAVLSDPRVIRLLRKMYTPDFPETFTLEYLAEAGGISAEQAEDLAGLLRLEPEDAELEEGPVRIAHFYYGSAALMGVFCAAYEAFLGEEHWYHAFNDVYRPVRPFDGENGKEETV